ncbi:DNA sulfur modification protein DndB [Mesorhizobium sp. B263B2A]|uniref:DNA sulfur modification protein DndB n=1 Tax=Mesorhizobium sp. B263B2A TaxID=2876669 RepID=UPI001CD0F95D|nr:DNA sulfur modification protein DndB [Mesorhizobium sp. B263B2A]MCA0029244.1 DNA sulfur modification protein DndB [Mesorhizobium sp. B263B2A]
MEVHVSAMRGKMGSRTYYACLMPMTAVPQFFKFTEWNGISAEDREQRVLNAKRVPDIARYINENEDDYLFSSITASYKSPPKFSPFDGNPETNIGTLKLQLGDELIINDGQHRCAGIVKALAEGSPSVKTDTLSVLLFPWETTDRVQQMFSDLNRTVVKTSKSLDILYDKRDDLAAATLAMVEQVPVFKDLTEKEDMALKAKSTKLFTLAALYDACSEVLKGHDKSEIMANAALLADYWSTVATHMPDWTKAQSGFKLPLEIRQERISTHSTVLRALGGLGSDLMSTPDWRDRLNLLDHVDWSKKNPEWQDVCISANSVVSNRQARFATKAFLKKKLELPLTDAELRSVTPLHELFAPLPAALRG